MYFKRPDLQTTDKNQLLFLAEQLSEITAKLKNSVHLLSLFGSHPTWTSMQHAPLNWGIYMQ